MSLNIRSNKKSSRKFQTTKNKFFNRDPGKPIVYCESGGIITSTFPLTNTLKSKINESAQKRSKRIKDILLLAGRGRYKIDLDHSLTGESIFTCSITLNFKHQQWRGYSSANSVMQALEFALDDCRRKHVFKSNLKHLRKLVV